MKNPGDGSIPKDINHEKGDISLKRIYVLREMWIKATNSKDREKIEESIKKEIMDDKGQITTIPALILFAEIAKKPGDKEAFKKHVARYRDSHTLETNDSVKLIMAAAKVSSNNKLGGWKKLYNFPKEFELEIAK